MNIEAIGHPSFNWEDLRKAYTIVYDRSPVRVVSFADVMARCDDHVCTDRCTFVNSGEVYICVASCHVHVCNEQYCDQLRTTREKRVCTFTGVDYELDDGVIFGYANADPENREYIDGRRTLHEVRLHEMMQACAAVSLPGRTENPVRRRGNHAIRLQSAIESPASWTPSPSPSPVTPLSSPSGLAPPTGIESSSSLACAPPRKKVRGGASALEQADSDQYSISALASTFMTSLGVPENAPIISTVAHACRTVWNLISTTSAFEVARSEYKPEFHVVVMLIKMRTAETTVGGIVVAPRLPDLVALFTGPRDFTRKPFGLPTAKWTVCEGVLRRCLSERASKCTTSATSV
jgi:hypothetical protein